MNFLSHYYFERDNANCYFVLGTVLPDLLKNADKSIVLHPEKLTHTDARVNQLINGWKKHLLVDKYFHSSKFFLFHSHALKLALSPVISGSPVKPFFLGHIAIELILDNLLLTGKLVDADNFYSHLQSCDDSVIDEFLRFSGMTNTNVFFKFFEHFKKERFLHSYERAGQISFALKRVCMRVWQNPFTPAQEQAVNDVILSYREGIKGDFISVFDDVAMQLAGEGR